MYYRYVDDLYCNFDYTSQIQKLHVQLNKMHEDMKFTNQTCKKNKLPYPDTQVRTKDNKFITLTYRKPISIDMLM